MTTTKSAHPLVVAAAFAVLLFCGVGSAALMGSLPSLHGDARPLDASTSSTQMAALSQQPAQLQPQPEPHMAAGGAMAGNQIEGNVRATHSYNIVVHLDHGKTRTIHQSAAPGWRQGDRVHIVNSGLRAD